MCSPMKMLFVTPAAMLPTVSASNTAAATLLADAAKTFCAAKMVAYATATATTAACARLLGQVALQRLFGVKPHEGIATPSSSASDTSSSSTATTCIIDKPAPTDDAADANTAHQASNGATAILPTHATCVPATTTAAKTETEQKPKWLVVTRAVAEHVVSIDDPLTTAVVEALIARHEALGRVPRDTVSQLISCLHAQHHDRESELLGTAEPLVMVDIVLRALKRHDFDMAATHTKLSRHWMRCYRIVWLEHTRRVLQRQYVEVEQGTKELRHALSLSDATGRSAWPPSEEGRRKRRPEKKSQV